MVEKNKKKTLQEKAKCWMLGFLGGMLGYIIAHIIAGMFQ